MKQYVESILHTGDHGLYLLELPTGYGKTYQAVQAMKEYALNPEDNRKIIYLTTLLKNLPQQDLLNAFGSIDEYNKHVLRIRSNFDEVTEKLEKIHIPDEFQNENLENLKMLVRRYNKAEAEKVSDQVYMDSLKERINKADKQLRRGIAAKLKKEFPEKKDRLEAIKNIEKWKWVGELYPAVFTDEYQILVMSISKFMTKNSCIIEPSYDFLTSALAEDAIVFMDEFDATKETIEDAILNEALSIKADYLNMFRQILSGLNPDNMARNLKDAYLHMPAESPSSYTFDKILEEAKKIAEKYHVNLSYKTKENSIDPKQNFLLKDASYHTLSQSKKTYIRASKDSQENKVTIYLETKEDYEKNKSDHDISVFSMLREINRFLIRFRIFLYSWADQYMHSVNSRRSATDDAMRQEDAINTILDKIGIIEKDRPFILRERRNPSVSSGKKRALPDTSFYQTGLELFELKDEDSHNDSTRLQLAAVYNTPEKILKYLAGISTVIGISATAEVPTVTGNYDLDYLQAELGKSFHRTPKDVKKRIQKELSYTQKAYEDGRVRVHAEMVKDQSVNFEVVSVCKSFFHDAEIAEICANIIQQKITDAEKENYIMQRYCSIAWAMHQFCSLSVRSMLYLGMALPDTNKDEMNTQILQEIFQCDIDDVRKYSASICEDMDSQKSLVILRSRNFDETKAALAERLSNGEKIFIMSTYQTLGAGQNLQYRVPKDIPIVELVPYQNDGDQRHFYKDIDAMYLGDITNLVVNVHERKLEEKEFLSLLFQIEEMYEDGEMGYMEKDDTIKVGFKAFSGDNSSRNNLNSMYKKDSILMMATKQVMQAIGRMCRTYMKSPDIYIFIDERLLDKLSAGEMEKHILSPEMKAIVELRKKLGKDYSLEEERILNLAEKKSSTGSRVISNILFNDWNIRTVDMWKDLRDLTLRLPEAWKYECEANIYARELYITSGKPQDRYFYSQFGDYQDAIIDFGTDKAAFRNSERARRKADRGQLNIQEVNEEGSGLPILMKYPGMKEYFLSQGYAVKWEPKDYIMSPVLFHNIYKAVLGEVAGKFILEKELGIHLTGIEEPSNFELFDYKMAEGVYVDFKNWKNNYLVDRTKALEKVRAKLKAIGGKRAYIISVIQNDKKDESTDSIDDSVIEIPGLIDRDGHPLYKNLKMIREEDF